MPKENYDSQDEFRQDLASLLEVQGEGFEPQTDDTVGQAIDRILGTIDNLQGEPEAGVFSGIYDTAQRVRATLTSNLFGISRDMKVGDAKIILDEVKA